LNNYKALGLLALIVGISFIILSELIHYSFSIFASKNIIPLFPNSDTIDLIIGVVFALLSLVGFGLSRIKSGKPLKTPITINEKCYSCDKELSPNVEQVEVTKNISDNEQEKVNICRDCIIKELNKQDGVCPECKKPLKWNGNLREFFGEWYHPRCVYDLQKDRNTKEVKETREVVVKFRCPYCKYVYDDSLDKCPQCGGKHT
jgi:hypothetical protein